MFFRALYFLHRTQKSYQMKMRPFMLSMAVLILAIATPHFISAAEVNHPNIVLIFTDDMGWGDLPNFTPQSKIRTPNIAQLVTEGTKLDDFYVVQAGLFPDPRQRAFSPHCAPRMPLPRRSSSLEPYTAGECTSPACTALDSGSLPWGPSPSTRTCTLALGSEHPAKSCSRRTWLSSRASHTVVYRIRSGRTSGTKQDFPLRKHFHG